jgi:hypothetical protein
MYLKVTILRSMSPRWISQYRTNLMAIKVGEFGEADFLEPLEVLR